MVRLVDGEKPETHLSLSLTPEYRKAQVKEGSVANTYPQLSVKGVGYDRLLGGLEIDIRLRDHLARSFEVRHTFYFSRFSLFLEGGGGGGGGVEAKSLE